MIIFHNIAAEQSANRLIRNEKKTANALQKLSTGLRINQAADDAAGLAISEKMRAQIRGLAQARRNIQDGSSLLATADGALQDINSPPLQRIRELLVEAGNDTLSQSDKAQIQGEIDVVKAEIDNIVTQAAFNNKKLFSDIPENYIAVNGANKLSGGRRVVAGENDTLAFMIDEQQFSITLEPGDYPAEDLLNELNIQLGACDENLIAAYNSDGTLRIIAENSQSINGFSGNAMDLICEETIGRSSGDIYAENNLWQNLIVTNGYNTSMRFKIDGEEYALTLAAGSYEPQQLLDRLNQQLDATGKGVTAYFKEDASAQYRYIVFHSPQYIIDSFSGPMMYFENESELYYPLNLRPPSSILFDTTVVGEQLKATVAGAAILSGGLTVTADNDKLTFAADGTSYEIKLTQGVFDKIDLLDNINAALETAAAPVEASYSGDKLILKHEIAGAGHTLNSFGGTALKDLMQIEVAYVPYSYDGSLTTAYARGQKSLGATTQIVANANDTLRFAVDGNPKQITIDAGSYNQADLLTKINEQLGGTNVTASYFGSQLALSFNETGNHLINAFSGTAYHTLLAGTGNVTTVAGQDKIPQGSTIPTPYSATAVTGAANLSGGITIAEGVNDTLNFNVDGAARSVTLDAGTYNYSALIAHVNAKVSPTGINAVSNGYSLVLRHSTLGSGHAISGFSGTAAAPLLTDTAPSIYPGMETSASITGRVSLSNTIVADGTNNHLEFSIGAAAYVVDLEEKSYTRSGLVSYLNAKFTEADIPAVASDYYGVLKLVAAEKGPGHAFSFVDNGAYTSLLEYHSVSPASFSDSGESRTAFVLGRVDLSEGVSIESGVNDELSFRIEGEDSSVTLAAGVYSAGELLAELTAKLSAFHVVPSYQSGNDGDKQLKLAYVPDASVEDTKLVIEGVGGNASYTLFYQASTKPTATKLVGNADLSQGVTITSGVNDRLTFKVDGEVVDIQLEARTYTAEELIQAINSRLVAQDIAVSASLEDDCLRLMYRQQGEHVIEAAAGNGADSLFYKTDSGDKEPDTQLQVGPNSDSKFDTGIPASLSLDIMGIRHIKTSTPKQVAQALTLVDRAMRRVSRLNSDVGAKENALEHLAANVGNTEENLTAAESRIRDVDLAKEVMAFTKNTLLQQAAEAMLAQANQQPQGVLQLLR